MAKSRKVKYILVYKNGTDDSITKDTIKVRTLTEQGLQNLLEDPNNVEDLVCYFPLDYLKKKSIIKPLLYIKENLI